MRQFPALLHEESHHRLSGDASGRGGRGSIIIIMIKTVVGGGLRRFDHILLPAVHLWRPLQTLHWGRGKIRGTTILYCGRDANYLVEGSRPSTIKWNRLWLPYAAAAVAVVLAGEWGRESARDVDWTRMEWNGQSSSFPIDWPLTRLDTALGTTWTSTRKPVGEEDCACFPH